jgi:hypothetical protein
MTRAICPNSKDNKALITLRSLPLMRMRQERQKMHINMLTTTKVY